MKNLTLTSLLLLSLSANALATGTYGEASDIFNVGAGARSLAMGGAFTGLADDASAPYFNPAGLAFMDEHQLMVMHAPMFIDTSYNYIASANPLGDKWGALALSDAMLLSDGFVLRDQFNNVTDSNGAMSHNAIFGSYARKITQQLSTGANVKFIQQKVAGFSGSTMGLDLGVLYKFMPALSLGAAFVNVNEPSLKLQSEADVYKPMTRIGAASEIFRGRLVLTADMTRTAEKNSLFAAGAEWHVNRLFALRSGFNANRSYTLGVGLELKKFRLDYAFSDTDLGAFNKVSFTWAWHNIYKTDIEPPLKEGRAIYPLSGFENQVVFKTLVPQQTVARWKLDITNAEGQAVRTLQGDLRPPETLNWDAKNNIGEPVVDGVYKYDFEVIYKNGKSWGNTGDITLALPHPENQNTIDMNLQLNGTKENELSNVQAQPQTEQEQQTQPQAEKQPQ